MDARGVSKDDIEAVGGYVRLLPDILVEVAEGKSEFVYLG